MKLLIATIIFTTLLYSNAFAFSGKTVIPLIQSQPAVETNLIITNITDHDLTVNINVYCTDLNTPVSNSYLTYSGFQNNNTEIGAKKIVQVAIRTVVCSGPTIISWSNKTTDNDLYGLIAAGQYWGTTSSWLTSFQINNGAPF